MHTAQIDKTIARYAPLLLIICVMLFSGAGCSVVSGLRNVNSSGEIALPDFPPYEGIKRTIAVFDFANNSRFGNEQLGGAITDMIIAALVRSDRFIVVERAALEQLLSEARLGQAGVVTAETSAEVAQLLGVQALIFGAISEIRLEQSRREIDPEKKDWSLALQASVANIALDFRVLETTSGVILMADSERAVKIRPGIGIRTEEWEVNDMHKFDDSLLGKASREAAHKVISKIIAITTAIDWYGKIIKLSASQDTVYCTPGESAGIKLGNLFDVYPRSSDESPEARATVQVIEFVGDKVCKAVKVDGDYAIQVGDLIRETSQHYRSTFE